MDILSIQNLSKNFGDNKVLNNISLKVKENNILGFIGENGAGKTTTMKIILGLIKADSGKITICNEEVKYGNTKTNKLIGYLPDVPEFYSYMKPYEYLRLCGEITGMPKKDIQDKSEELLNLVGLENTNKKIGSFSRGMKQRLGVAQALLNNPKLLICDEPTSALDPIGRKEILEILKAVKGKTTVIFSTHILSDVEKICDNIAVLHKGNIVLEGEIQKVKSQYTTNGLYIEFPLEENKNHFMNCYKKQVQEDRNSVIIKSSNINRLQEEVMSILYSNKIIISKLEVIEPTLENLFMEVVK
ncbi:MAG: ABC transporter ATP-binding protein [Clostridiales bacterium]|nr:ABC transporter ATP-binding protein [Clostridiales bacterium]